MGFGAVSSPHYSSLSLSATTGVGTAVSSSVATIASASFKGTFKSGQLNKSGDFDSNVFYGFDFDRETNKEYLAPLMVANSNTTGNVTI